MKIEDCFYIGYLTKTRGLKGEIQLYFDSDEPEELTLDMLLVDMNGKLVPFFVISYQIPQKKTGYFFLEDVDHIDKAEKLLKKQVYLPLTLKPQRNENDFTYKDLVGFEVTDEKLGVLGLITQVQEYPQQFVAALTYKQKEVLFPLNDHFVQQINIENKDIKVNLPDGLLDIYLEE